MLAIVEEKNMASGCHSDNTDRYLVLMLFKMGLDAVALYLCCRKLNTSFFSMCGLSIVLADSVIVLLLSSFFFLGPQTYLVSLCFTLANASATYKALPLPMMCLGLFSYCLESTYAGKESGFSKFLRHTALTLLVWIIAAIHSFGSVKYNLTELDYQEGFALLVCEVQESTLITYFILGLFSAVVCTMLPFLSRIPHWVSEADRLSAAMEEQEDQSSDLSFISTNCVETKGMEENHLEETVCPRPPLWFSLTLGFGLFWMPYLTVSVVCILLDFGVPAYITVNLLWLECINSLLTGVVFWANSSTEGPYSFQENVCMWPIYWQLSKGTQQQPFSTVMFNPTKDKRHTFLYV